MVFAYCTLVGLRKCAENTFITLWKSPLALSKSKKWSGSVTVLPELLEFYMLLYEPHAP
jgi:hypothetical protein